MFTFVYICYNVYICYKCLHLLDRVESRRALDRVKYTSDPMGSPELIYNSVPLGMDNYNWFN